MGDLDPFAFIGKQHGMIAHNVTGPDDRKADTARFTFARLSLPTVNSAFIQGAAQTSGDHIAHAQGSTGRCIHLVAVMGFGNLDVGTRADDPGGDFQQFEAQVDAHAHVGRNHHRQGAGSGFQGGSLRRTEPGGSHNHANLMRLTYSQMGQGRFRPGKVHHHIHRLNDCRQRVRYRHADGLATDEFSGIPSHCR